MARDLGFNDHVLGMGIGIFFVSYVTLQIPSALLVVAGFAVLMFCALVLLLPAPQTRVPKSVTSS